MIGCFSCRGDETERPQVSRLHMTWNEAVEAAPEPRYHREP